MVLFSLFALAPCTLNHHSLTQTLGFRQHCGNSPGPGVNSRGSGPAGSMPSHQSLPFWAELASRGGSGGPVSQCACAQACSSCTWETAAALGAQRVKSRTSECPPGSDWALLSAEHADHLLQSPCKETPAGGVSIFPLGLVAAVKLSDTRRGKEGSYCGGSAAGEDQPAPGHKLERGLQTFSRGVRSSGSSRQVRYILR